MESNPRRPAHLHAGSVRPVRPKPYSRVTWRRHLHNEPPGLLRRLHGVPRGADTTSEGVTAED